MDTKIIKEMARKLRPVLKDRRKAERLLERYWADKIAIVWTVHDVYRAANERGLALTKTEALNVLHAHSHSHNKQYGLKWADITSYIEEHVMGRPLTKKEINQFIKQDIITVQK